MTPIPETKIESWATKVFNVNYLNKCFEKDTSIVSRKITDELILVPIRKNVGDLENIFTLNEVGTHIWEQINGQKKAYEIKDSIMEEFEVSAEEAEADLIEFLQQLKKIGAIHPRCV